VPPGQPLRSRWRRGGGSAHQPAPPRPAGPTPRARSKDPGVYRPPNASKRRAMARGGLPHVPGARRRRRRGRDHGERRLRVGRRDRPAPSERSTTSAPSTSPVRCGGGSARGRRHAGAGQGGCAAPAASAEVGIRFRQVAALRDRTGRSSEAFGGPWTPQSFNRCVEHGRRGGRPAPRTASFRSLSRLPEPTGYAPTRKRPKSGTRWPPRSSLVELGARRTFDPFRTPRHPYPAPGHLHRSAAGRVSPPPVRRAFADAARTPAEPPPGRHGTLADAAPRRVVTARSPTPPGLQPGGRRSRRIRRRRLRVL
jgi:hypothetical protein